MLPVERCMQKCRRSLVAPILPSTKATQPMLLLVQRALPGAASRLQAGRKSQVGTGADAMHCG